jgi:DNA ligase (NAD+)
VSFVLLIEITFTQFGSLETKWGFKVPKEAILAHSLEDVFSILTWTDRHDLPYETDGVVSKSFSISG